jgi:hypothetical protein
VGKINKYITISILLIGISGCAILDQFDGGYRYCKKHDVYWHKQWGETHNCKEGAIIHKADGSIKVKEAWQQ